VAQLSDHLRICFDESKSENRRNLVFSTKNFAFSIGTRFALKPSRNRLLANLPAPEMRARNSKPQTEAPRF
jgi:hypothetical protein